MNNNKAKSRDPPHSASSSEQQQQKKISSTEFFGGIASETKRSIPSQGTKSIGGNTGKSIIHTGVKSKNTAKNTTSIGSRFTSLLSSHLKTSKTTSAIGGTDNTTQRFASACGVPKPPGVPGALKSSSKINASSSAAPTIGGTERADCAIGGAVATIVQPLALKGATPATIGGTGAVVDPDSTNSPVKKAAAGITNLQVSTDGNGQAVFVLIESPVTGKPMKVIGALDSSFSSKFKLSGILCLQTKNLYNISTSGRKVSLQYHTTSQGVTVKCVWVIPQSCAQQQTILFQGEEHTIPPHFAARGFDENYLPLQIVAEEQRENRRWRKSGAITLTAFVDGERKILATLPFQQMACRVMRTDAANIKIGSRICNVHYSHTENIDGDEVVTSRSVDIDFRKYSENDGQLGMTTELGEMVLPRPHLVMPADAIPLSPKGRFDFSLANLRSCSVAHRVSLLSEVVIIPDLAEEMISENLKRLETMG